MSDNLCYNGTVKKHNEVPAAHPSALFYCPKEKIPRFVPKPFFHVKKHAVFTKLRTVLDGFGQFWTKFCAIMVLSKKAKALAAHLPALFLCPNQKGSGFHVILHLPPTSDTVPFLQKAPPFGIQCQISANLSPFLSLILSANRPRL